MTDQYAEEKRWVFSCNLKEENEDEWLRQREMQIPRKQTDRYRKETQGDADIVKDGRHTETEQRHKEMQTS